MHMSNEKRWVLEVDSGYGWQTYIGTYYDKGMAKRHGRELKANRLAKRTRVRTWRESDGE